LTKIYEALEQAQKDSKGVEKQEPVSVRSAFIPLAAHFAESEMEREMIRLYQNLQSLFSEGEGRILEFLGSREGEGTSTIIREFARVMATKFDKWVVLLDADRYHPAQHDYFKVEANFSWEDAVRGRGSIDRALHRIGEASLFVSPISENSDSAPQIFNAPGMDPILKELKERFDLVLIDCPPATTFPDGLAVCRKVDGVILVVEAEKTRWPVIESVKEMISHAGGKILGVVLNKRHHHIPEFIYKRL